ncbi:MAG TPA: SRPBCC domain-containing protein [Phycisphaerales bacterium]|nr:SRPBCC domain-containing protein [Phycisphaerales bacterium]
MPTKTATPARTGKTVAKVAKKAATSKKAAGAKPAAGISDGAVERATGKPQSHWFKVLDTFARKLGEHNHKLAAEHLHDAHAVPEWWCQMVTVAYERDRGLRAKHERPDGFSVSASRTINVPISDLYNAWNGRARAKWLPDDFTVRKATQDRSIRITWGDGTNLEVMFYPKGDSKAQVTVQHSKLPSAAAGKRVKEQWGARLDALRDLLEH